MAVYHVRMNYMEPPFAQVVHWAKCLMDNHDNLSGDFPAPM